MTRKISESEKAAAKRVVDALKKPRKKKVLNQEPVKDEAQLELLPPTVQDRNREIVEAAMAAYRQKHGGMLSAQHELMLNATFQKNEKLRQRQAHLAGRPESLVLPTELVLVRVNPRFPQNPCFIERGMDRKTGRKVARRPARELRGKREGGPGVGTGRSRYLRPGVDTMKQLRIWSAAWVEAQGKSMPDGCRFGQRDERVRQWAQDAKGNPLSPAKQWWYKEQLRQQAAKAEGAA